MSLSKPNPIPARYRRVTAALVVNGADAALTFYVEVFGATERLRTPGPGGTIVHAEVEIGDSVIIVEDASPHMGTKAPPKGGLDGTPMFLFIYVEDVDARVGRAVAAGARLLREVKDQFYGDRSGGVEDPFGHVWYVSTHVEDVTREEVEKRMAASSGQH